MSIAGEELADGDADLGDHRGGPSREEPLALEGPSPKCSFRGRQNHNWVPDSGSSPPAMAAHRTHPCGHCADVLYSSATRHMPNAKMSGLRDG